MSTSPATLPPSLRTCGASRTLSRSGAKRGLPWPHLGLSAGDDEMERKVGRRPCRIVGLDPNMAGEIVDRHAPSSNGTAVGCPERRRVGAAAHGLGEAHVVLPDAVEVSSRLGVATDETAGGRYSR